MSWGERYQQESGLPRINYVTTTGADPEFWLVDDASGDIVPSFEVLPRKGLAKKTVGGYASFYTDGFQGEFRLDSVGSCHEGVTAGIGDALRTLHGVAVGLNAHLSLRDMMPIPAKSKVEYSKHLALGCLPSLNAYGKPPLAVENPAALPIRFAGGHIHFGLYTPDPKAYVPVIKALDAVSGVMGVYLGHSLCSPDRRQFYGVAGEYRTPRYGLEYRTLSPYWMADPALTYFTLDLARKVVNQVLGKGTSLLKWIGDEDTIQQCINSNNPSMAREILEANRDELGYLLYHCYTPGSPTSEKRYVKLVDLLLEEGMSLFCKDPEALTLNWGICSTGYTTKRFANLVSARVRA